MPDDQRLILEISKVIKEGYLQQNAYHKNDANVSLNKQYKMLTVIDRLYEAANKCIKEGTPISKIKNEDLFYKIITMKYNVSEENLELLDELIKEIDEFYNSLGEMYNRGGVQNETKIPEAR